MFTPGERVGGEKGSFWGLSKRYIFLYYNNLCRAGKYCYASSVKTLVRCVMLKERIKGIEPHSKGAIHFMRNA